MGNAAFGWNLFADGCPGGESPTRISERADRVVAQLAALEASVLLFSHGHFLRVLAVRWIGLPVAAARHFALGTASLSVLGCEHSDRGDPAIRLWNDDGRLP